MRHLQAGFSSRQARNESERGLLFPKSNLLTLVLCEVCEDNLAND